MRMREGLRWGEGGRWRWDREKGVGWGVERVKGEQWGWEAGVGGGGGCRWWRKTGGRGGGVGVWRRGGHIMYSTGVFGTQLIKQRRGEMQKGWDRPSRWWGLAGANAQPPELLTAMPAHRNYSNTFTLFSGSQTHTLFLCFSSRLFSLIPRFVLV